MEGVWHLDWNSASARPRVPPNPYISHWSDCVNDVNDDDLKLDDRRVALAIVDCLREGLDKGLDVLKEQIRGELLKTGAINIQITDDHSLVALTFAVSLWTHSTIDFAKWSSESLREILRASLPARTDPVDVCGILDNDFCAKNLWRKGGIQVIWTNDIREHLSCDQDTVKVFRNSSMLRSLHDTAMADPSR